MSGMFTDAVFFDQPIENWDVSNVTDMSFMFSGVETFNQPIGNWDVSNVTDMSGMFSTKFNQPIGNWDVSNVTCMFGLFSSARDFNQAIGSWDVSKVTNMHEMFADAISFNQDIGKWDVRNVTDMSGMFSGAEAFNQPIGKWDVRNVADMSNMFENAKSFNQPTENWVSQKVIEEEVVWKDENISKWNKSEKVLLFALLIEIALADDDFCETEKEVLGKKLFGIGVLDEIMEIQVAADLIYSKGNIGDTEKIATDFNKLNMIKKNYIIKSISEMIQSRWYNKSNRNRDSKKINRRFV